MENKNERAPETSFKGIIVVLWERPALTNAVSEKTVQIQVFGNNFCHECPILEIFDFLDQVPKYKMFLNKTL